MIYDLLEILVRAVVCVLAVIFLTRLGGLRSFSKMSSFDFAITVAFGSVIASSVISPKESIGYGLAALVGLFAVQGVIAWCRTRYAFARRTLDNDPLLIMKNGEILHANLKLCNLTESDLYGKLREANAFDLRRVHAVVVEPTGDVSVLHGHGDPEEKVSPALLQGVRE